MTYWPRRHRRSQYQKRWKRAVQQADINGESLFWDNCLSISYSWIPRASAGIGNDLINLDRRKISNAIGIVSTGEPFPGRHLIDLEPSLILGCTIPRPVRLSSAQAVITIRCVFGRMPTVQKLEETALPCFAADYRLFLLFLDERKSKPLMVITAKPLKKDL